MINLFLRVRKFFHNIDGYRFAPKEITDWNIEWETVSGSCSVGRNCFMLFNIFFSVFDNDASNQRKRLHLWNKTAKKS